MAEGTIANDLVASAGIKLIKVFNFIYDLSTSETTVHLNVDQPNLVPRCAVVNPNWYGTSITKNTIYDNGILQIKGTNIDIASGRKVVGTAIVFYT